MKDLIVHVDFYKSTGKWYASGEVNVREARLYKGRFREAIYNYQNIVVHPRSFHAVVRNVNDNDDFADCLLLAEEE